MLALMASLPAMFETFQLFKKFEIDRSNFFICSYVFANAHTIFFLFFVVDIERFEHFVLDVRSRYQDNPYHNFRHACKMNFGWFFVFYLLISFSCRLCR
jgi:hypothetical protein